MKVEIWSDVMCPFCYIGKRNFEQALAQFPHQADVEVSWHSFQLDPNLKVPAGTSVYAYLAERKGQSLAWSEQVHAQVAQSAKQVGLDYRFDIAVIANSFDAHRLLQMANRAGKGEIAEERFFRAYFTEGMDIADPATLRRLAEEIGLDGEAVEALLQSDQYGAEVVADGEMAAELGATGVPFFVFDRRFGVMGAQPPATFLRVMHQAHEASRPL